MDLVKLGGSVITDKAKVTTLRRAHLLRLAGEIAEAGREAIVVHGAGSFGHVKAAKHRLHQGYLEDDQLAAVSEVQRDVRQLNLAVVDALRAAGLKPVSLPPSAIARLDDGVLRHIDIDVFHRYADLGFTPVTFGDVVLDARRWFGICSGDLLMLALATALRPESAVFVSDVDGVYTADPKRARGAKLLRRVGPGDLSAIDMKPPAVDDVTGSLEAKLLRMLDVARYAGRCVLVNGLRRGRLLAALTGDRVVGTVIVS